jgi:hypothetical protein
VSAPLPSAIDRFSHIIERLCKVIGAQLPARRLTEPVILLIWARVRRIAARFTTLAVQVRAGTVPAQARRRPPKSAASRAPGPDSADPANADPDAAAPAGSRPGRRRAPAPLPNSFAWLVRLIPHEAATSGSQLRHLLTDPEMVALLTAAPELGRILRPLCRMLGVEPGFDLPPPFYGPPRPIRPARPPRPPAATPPPPPPLPPWGSDPLRNPNRPGGLILLNGRLTWS